MSKKSAVFILGMAFCAPSFAQASEADFASEASRISEAVEESKAKHIDQSDLRDLLRDDNPQVRKAAVKNSRAYILNSSVNEDIMDILRDRYELADIRIEAARVLSYATTYSRVSDRLMDIVKYNNEPKELRIMAYKALWTGANNSRVEDLLEDAVKYNEKDRETRRAAIWAMFATSQNYKVKDLLVEIARNKTGEEEATRIEAIKSLYNGLGHFDAKDKITEIAKDQTERKPVRLIAIKALSSVNNDSRVKRFLEETMEYEKDLDLRVAAMWALSPERSEINELFHLGYKIENGPFVNPIEKE
ncbi:MAG: hypothetical protein COT17_05240 [Elusimicrobia bacterium CG08_land_8_20_14_0_20_51_18]|nr:MAG: hypothetical protein COT17_05240 [Elusimicrobia bacterium CG08_land_8_20_14_0_20_51_18]